MTTSERRELRPGAYRPDAGPKIPPPGGWPPRGPKVCEYPYRDPGGHVVMVKSRFEPGAYGAAKSFSVRARNRFGCWGYRITPNASELIYRLPEVLAGVESGATVWVTEGEKDADRGASVGLCTTCAYSPNKVRAVHGSWLRKARRVVIVADADAPGARNALCWYDALAEADADPFVFGRVRFVRARFGKDLTDHLTSGGRPTFAPRAGLVPVDVETLRAEAPAARGVWSS